MGLKQHLGKIAYGSLFVILGPALLWWWAQSSAATVHLPALYVPWAGIATTTLGILLMALGMRGLWIHGGGLPMNAFPPPKLVRQGVYAVIPHPIYVGFIALCFGVSLWTGSASGLWLVTPCTALILWALVAGYERRDLEQRFGELPRPWLSLPADTPEPVSLSKRWAVMLLIFVPWLTLFSAIGYLGRSSDAITVFLPGEMQQPVWVWSEWIYITAYLVPLVVLVPQTARELRRFAVQGLLATAVVTLIFLTIPIISPPRPFDASGPAAWLLQQEQAWSDSALGAFPSFHVIWVFLAAEVIRRRWSRYAIVSYAWATAVTLSCWTTGMHAVIDICGGLVFVALFIHYQGIWECLRRGTQWIAGSRQEWRLGPVRIINHGLYAGIGAGLGIWIIGCLVGGDLWALPLVGVCGIVGAALWAQLVEGSPVLLRPFGYYGSVFGSIGGLILCWGFGANVALLLGAFATAAPIIQAWGRLRCLVQGCCHGHVAPSWLGIVYTHPQSRVVTIAHLCGVPLHPTQLYSILGNLIIAAILMRLWFLGLPPLFLAGLYLLFSSIARFVEEGFRGEPQTIRFAGLPIYQWLAIILSITGIILTSLPGLSVPQPHWGDWNLAAISIGFAGFTWFAMGVDFPESHWRFSRLT